MKAKLKRKIPRFWRALETVYSLAGVRLEWKEALDRDFDVGHEFLRPMGGLADSYPCPSPGGEGCPRGIAIHGPDDIVAFCRCNPRQCEDIKLTRDDIIIYELDVKLLGKSIASVMGFSDNDDDGRQGPFLHIGDDYPYEGFRFPVFLWLPLEPRDLGDDIARLMVGNSTPFVLLTPTRNFWRPGDQDLLRSRKSAFIALDETLAWDKGAFAPIIPVEAALSDFHSRVLPSEKEETHIDFFPTPPGTTWENVTISYVNGHLLRIKIEGQAQGKSYHFSEMGMKDSRSKNPTKQWKLLLRFIQKQGYLADITKSEYEKTRKQKEALAGTLRDFLRIGSDPFITLENEKGWQSRFQVLDPDA